MKLDWLFRGGDGVPAGARVEPTLAIQNASPENPSTNLADPASWLYEAMGGGASAAGIHVSEHTAMRSTAVFACVALKSGIAASLPLNIYERTPNGRRLADNHRLYPLLHSQPNEAMTSFTWMELLEANVLLAGNHYSIIDHDNAARVIGLIPAMPQQVTVRRVNYRNRYRFQFPDGVEELDQDDVLHVPGPGFDGVKGLSRIASVGRESIGLGLALQEFVGRMHANGMRPSISIEMAKGLSPEGMKRLRTELDALYSGVHNAGRWLLLDAGMKASAMQLSPEDAQTLDTRRYQVVDICRIFGVPPHMVGETDRSTTWGTGIEQQTIGFQKFSMDPDLGRIEAELNRKLLSPPFYCEFNREALSAMDAKTISELYAQGVQNARYTPNEVRRLTNLPDLPGGEKLYINAATVPIDSAGKPTTAAPPPTPSQRAAAILAERSALRIANLRESINAPS